MKDFRDVVTNFLKTGIQMLPPGGKRAIIVATGDIKNKMTDKQTDRLISTNLSITYEERSFLYYLCRKMKKNTNNFVLDYGSFDGIYVKSELYLMRKAIEKLSESD